MYSMTGYGKGEYSCGGIELTCEVKTVNNRFLDIGIKSPKLFVSYEEVIRNTIKSKLTRGHIDVFISLVDKREKSKNLFLDEALALSYYHNAEKLSKLIPNVTFDLTISHILRYPDVLKEDGIKSLDSELTLALDTALNLALDKLNQMRKREGEKLESDMLSRVATIEKIVNNISERAPKLADEYHERLKEKVARYLENVQLDESRLLTEVAVFADKSNIDEELTRLKSHIEAFREISKEDKVGRKLDFLIQEYNRECNTICSKSNDIAITKYGLELKNEIEKIREQVQNVE